MQIMHGYSKSVIGRDMYSDNTLRHMTKSELIELLKIAQHNYEAVLEAYGNSVTYSERLLKERDDGIREFAEKLKQREDVFCEPAGEDDEYYFKFIPIDVVDDLVKEMVGDT